MNTANFPKNKERKRAEAKIRQETSDKLSPQQKLEKLDGLFGPGKGATKERIKLHQKIAQAEAPKHASKAQERREKALKEEKVK